jgi:release factor glutamine methyltransferase
MDTIYQPREDSYFFSDFLKKYLTKNISNLAYLTYLDLGTASGILAQMASRLLKKENIFTSDINKEAVKLVKEKGINAIHSDLFNKIPQTFDLITFNAPYLPFDKREPKDSQLATTGGKNGDEISAEFLKQATNHLNKNGKIFLLISSLTPMSKIKKFNPKVVAKKKLFSEELLILQFSKQ